jgi:hypothetical protein
MSTSSKKTMIWRGGLVAVSGGRDQTRIGTGDALAAVIAEARPKEALAAPTSNEVTQSTALAGADASDAAPSSAVASEQAQDGRALRPIAPACASTRIMPIESLFPEAQTGQESPPSVEHGATESATAAADKAWKAHIAKLFAQGLAYVQRDRKRTALYGGAATALLIVALWPAPREEVAVLKTTQLSAAKQVPRAGEATVASAVEAPQPEPPSISMPAAGLERAAVDALAAGDLERAQKLYLQLAERAPRPSPFSEAARILRRSALSEP